MIVSWWAVQQATFISLGEQPTAQLQTTIKNTIEYLGPLLAEAIIYNIGGHGARSGLDKLADPLKKMVVKQVRSKMWLEAALFRDTFPSNKVGDGDKRTFLQKVMK